MSASRLWIRADASQEIGTGHIFRCLSIAQELKQVGIVTIFICRCFDGNLVELISSRGFEVIVLPARLKSIQTDVETPKNRLPHSQWLQASQQEDFIAVKKAIGSYVQEGDQFLIDHFAIDCEWEQCLKKTFELITFVIDGQADRKHCTDYVIDPNLCAEPKKWNGCLEKNTQLKQGFDFVPIASQFESFKFQVKTRLTSVLISFGGVDSLDFTYRAIANLVALPLQFHVVVGKNYAGLNNLQVFCNEYSNITLHVQTNKMAALMATADLAVGAGGTMVWERCMAFLPSIVTSIAPNQIEQIACVEKLGIGVAIEASQFETQLNQQVTALLNKPQLLQDLSAKAQSYAQKRQKFAWTKLLTEKAS